MQPLDLKNYSAFTARLSVKPTVPVSSSAISSTQTVYPVQVKDKIASSVEYSPRIFSPYLTPSAVHVENRQLAQGSVAPTYQHNIAATKYFNVSITPKPRSHLQTGLIA